MDVPKNIDQLSEYNLDLDSLIHQLNSRSTFCDVYKEEDAETSTSIWGPSKTRVAEGGRTSRYVLRITIIKKKIKDVSLSKQLKSS